MKKLIALVIAMLFIIPALVTADDKFSIGGSYDLFAYKMKNYDDFNDNNNNDDRNYFYQRFRVANTIKPADDVTAYFRFDLVEGTWGTTFNQLPVARGTNTTNSKIHYDFAWVKVDKEMYSLQLGQQYFGLGYAWNEVIAQGIRANLKLDPATISLMYSKVDEGGNTNDEIGNKDRDFYAIQASFAGDGFNAGAFWALDDRNNTDTNLWVFGIYGGGAFGAVNLKAELNMFGGDAAPTVDFVGTQLFVEAKYNVSDAWMLGAQLFYAQGNNDPNEIQRTNIGDLASNRQYSYGFIEGWDLFDVHPMMPFGQDAGVTTLQIITDYKVSDALLVQAALAYGQPEEDEVTAVDSAIVFNLSFAYTIATNTQVGLHYNLVVPDMDAGFEDDNAQAIAARFTLKF